MSASVLKARSGVRNHSIVCTINNVGQDQISYIFDNSTVSFCFEIMSAICTNNNKNKLLRAYFALFTSTYCNFFLLILIATLENRNHINIFLKKYFFKEMNCSMSYSQYLIHITCSFLQVILLSLYSHIGLLCLKLISLFLASWDLYGVDQSTWDALPCLSVHHSSFKAHCKDHFPHEGFLDFLINSYALFICDLRTLCTQHPIGD